MKNNQVDAFDERSPAMNDDLYAAISEIQARNIEIEKLEEENKNQIEEVWEELYTKFSVMLKLVENTESPVIERAKYLDASCFSERDVYERYCKMISTIKIAYNVLRYYHENEAIQLEDDDIDIRDEWTCYGETDYDSIRFSLDWIRLDEPDLRQMVLDTVQKAESEAECALALYDEMVEKRERAKYEELKAKYESEK